MSSTTEQVYDYIREQWETQQQVPTLREIAEACEVSKTTVIYHLDKLEGQGHISREPYKARSIRLTTTEESLDETVQAVYDYIQNAIDHGVVPTQAEIAAQCYISRTTVRRCLVRLEAQGYITLGESSRSIQLLDRTDGL